MECVPAARLEVENVAVAVVAPVAASVPVPSVVLLSVNVTTPAGTALDETVAVKVIELPTLAVEEDEVTVVVVATRAGGVSKVLVAAERRLCPVVVGWRSSQKRY